jgi:hypothetical protein
MIDLADVLGIPEFTQEERARIDKVYKELRAKYDPIVKGGFRYRKPPPDFYRDAADKERHAEFMAGVQRKR